VVDQSAEGRPARASEDQITPPVPDPVPLFDDQRPLVHQAVLYDESGGPLLRTPTTLALAGPVRSRAVSFLVSPCLPSARNDAKGCSSLLKTRGAVSFDNISAQGTF